MPANAPGRNPFNDDTLEELGAHCSDLVIELESGQRRSPEQRRALVARTRDLLIAIAGRFRHASEGMPGTPEQEVARLQGDFVESFDRYRMRLERSAAQRARREAIIRAANFALGRGAVRWLDDPDVLWSARRSYIAAQSEEGFAAVLHELTNCR